MSTDTVKKKNNSWFPAHLPKINGPLIIFKSNLKWYLSSENFCSRSFLFRKIILWVGMLGATSDVKVTGNCKSFNQ